MNYTKMLSTIDTHVAGEAFRIVTNAFIHLNEEDIYKAHETLKKEFDVEKNLLLNEPRGHRGMHGCMVLPTKAADFRLLFFTHQDVSVFKYEGLLAAVTALLEAGTIKEKEDGIYTIETVDGIYSVKTVMKDGEVIEAGIESKPSLQINKNEAALTVRVDDKRNYIIHELPEMISSLELKYLAAIQRWGKQKTAALSLAGVQYEAVVLIEKGRGGSSDVRSVTFEKDGYILRSPGIDTSFALLALKNKQSTLRNESIFGSCLEVSRIQTDENGEKITVTTEAFVTGTHDFIVDEDDPLQKGFLLA